MIPDAASAPADAWWASEADALLRSLETTPQGLTARDEASALDGLSVRERQIIAMVVRGHSSTEIGTLLHLSPKTVDSYRSRLMGKLGVSDVPALVRLAIRAGLIDADEP